MEDKKKQVKEHFEMSRQKIADEFGISRVTVAEIEKSALRKLRRALEAKGYRVKDFF